MKRRLFILSLYFSAFVFGIYIINISQVRATYSGICNLIERHYYSDSERFQKWLNQCQMFALSIPPLEDRKEVLSQFQNLMDVLESSHFQIYDQEQEERLWQGMVADTGLDVVNTIEGVLVKRVVAGSPGFQAGIQSGDFIVSVNGNEDFYLKDVGHLSGLYQVRRLEKIFEVQVKVERYQIDGPPTLSRLGSVGILDISSFRSEFFEREDWGKMVMQIQGLNRLVIDLRQNAGGNFVSMLRALSPFFCEPTVVGKLKMPRTLKSKLPELEFRDLLEDEKQLEEIDRASHLKLKTFAGYAPCFRGRVNVLVSANTSSVAEIFTQALRAHRNAMVIGRITAGEVVLAVWYPLRQLGPQYTISIPKALYVGEGGEVLEGLGIEPDQTLNDEDIWKPASEILEDLLRN